MVLFDGFKSIRSVHSSARDEKSVELWVKRVFKDEFVQNIDVKSCTQKVHRVESVKI